MEDEFILQLKGYGYSLTSGRKALFHHLRRYGSRTISELHDELGTEMDRASLYRTIDLLLRLGVIQQVGMGRTRRLELTDRFSSHHHHFTCNICSMTESLEDLGLEDELKVLARRQGFVLQSHHIELAGVCSACLKQGQREVV